MFESNNELADEIRYVFDRQKRASKMGNILDRPTLLMKKQFVRNTTTGNENLKKGTDYSNAKLQDIEMHE